MPSKYRRNAAQFRAALLAVTLSATAVEASVEISTKPTQNMTCAGGTCTPTAQKAVLNVGDLANMLSSGDVKISSGNLAQDIEIDAALSWTSTSHLTLDSYHAISFNKPVVVAGTGAVTITTNDGGSGGDFRFFGRGHVEFWDLHSKLVINGNAYALEKSIRGLKRGGSFVALARSVNAGKSVYTAAPIDTFGGTLEGLGNTISNLTIDDENSDDLVGLIGFLEGTGVIRDLGLVSVDIRGLTPDQAVAALVVQNQLGTIANCYATGKLFAGGENSLAAGLVGLNAFGTVTLSFSSVVVSATGEASVAVGGLVGINGGGCHAGRCTGLVDQSYATGMITGADGTMVGGLVGENFGGIITNSYANGATTGGSNALVGGLVGSNLNSPSEQATPVITNTYSTGVVSGGTGATVGGLIGQDLADPNITNAYWDMDTSGVGNPEQGAGNIANDPGITGLTTQQFKSGLPAGFDKKVWKEKANINNGYPYLIDLPPG